MASKIKPEAQARLAMMEDFIVSQVARMRRYLEEDRHHHRLTSAKYVLDFIIEPIKAWIPGMRHRIGYDEAAEALERIEAAHRDGLQILALSRRRPAEQARRAAIRAAEREFMVRADLNFAPFGPF